MAFDPDQFLIIAKEMYESQSAEAYFRTIVNRAYYAAFWHARLLLEADGTTLRGGGEHSHNDVWDFLEGDLTEQGDSLGEQGRALKALRTRADYYDNRPVNANTAFQAIRQAERLIDGIKRLS